MKRYLAIDIGASSGRHIVGWVDEGKIVAEEVYRFANNCEMRDGHLVWDIAHLFSQVKEGLKQAFSKYGDIASVSVDTWAVDYVLMKGEEEILPCYAYRDSRTESVIEQVHAKVPFAELYARTGIQFQPFNTVYQLYADKLEGRLARATDYLMLPEYLMYKLTGVRATEYTNATSTGLVNAKTRRFDEEILSKLGFDAKMFRTPLAPGTSLGRFLPEVRKEVGGDVEVVLCATHDTASAVLAAPLKDQAVPYISSGTWSLLGVEQANAHTDVQSLGNNFSNEGSPDGFRYQKNIMGLWMLQSVRRELGGISFPEMMKMAQESDCPALVDCNDRAFLAPKSMRKAVCEKAGQALSDGQIVRCIYESLAKSYAEAVGQLSCVLSVKFDRLHIIGGGCRDAFLNSLTAKRTGLEVVAGPVEATSLGNLLVQMIAGGDFEGIAQGRAAIEASFGLEKYSA